MSLTPADRGFADPAGRYRLEARIATGGMGEVWRATDLVLDRPVAIKVLKAEYADDLTFRHRFETEARNAGSLHHKGIAAVFDFGEGRSTDGGAPRPYLVMELVDGRPLSELLRPHSPMDPDAARDLIAQAADAIEVAHRAGIVHRDIKPANLLVTPDRRVKITDFGIARAADSMALTQTGQVMGTPAYISPEQARGEPATDASDIYALGVVLFECLAGHRPFQGETPVTTALAHVRAPVPDLPPSVPRWLAGVTRRALAKDPADRYASAADLATALRHPGAAAPPRTRRTTVPPPVAAAADAPTTQVLPAVPPPPPVEEPARPTRRGVPAWVWVVLVVAVVAAAAALVVALTSGNGTPSDQPSPSSSGPTSSSGSTSSGPQTVDLDENDYLGRDVGAVAAELQGLKLKVTRDEVTNPGGHTAGVVTSVSPTGTVEVGQRITVQYWGPEPSTPSSPATTGSSSTPATPTSTPPSSASTPPTDSGSASSPASGAAS